MDDIISALDILTDTIENGKRHRHYDRTVALSDQYIKLFTGEGADEYLQQFVPREDHVMFDQRKLLYQSVMPAVAGNLSKVFQKPLRSNRVFSSIESDDTAAMDEVIDRMQSFWNGESNTGVDAYLQNRWLDLVKFDPNAFFVVSFKDFDADREKTRPFPIEYSSKEAINFNYINGKLDWLIVETKIKYKKKVFIASPSRRVEENDIKEAEGSKYIIYLENNAISLTEVDKDDKITDIKNAKLITIGKQGKERVFVIQYYSPKTIIVPAQRVGFIPDPITKGETCLSIFHDALPFFYKELKSGSELDLTMALHAFPQKIQYAPRCEGDKEKGVAPCMDGRDMNGKTCPACNGTGIGKVHTTAQDILLVPLPKKGESYFDLEKLLVYKSPPVDLIRFQDEYVDRLTDKARRAIFGGTTLVQQQGIKTATEMDYAMDDMYDTLHPFAQKYSALWLFFLSLIAELTDNAGKVQLYHKFPADFKFKTLDQLYTERNTAKQSGLPQHILDAIDIDIQEILYADDQDTLTKIKVKSLFYPFSGKDINEIQSIIIQNRTTKYYEVLYTHFEIIFNEIDNAYGANFYLLTYERQRALVEIEVQKIIDQIAKPNYQPLNIEPDEPESEQEEPEPSEGDNPQAVKEDLSEVRA